MAGKSHRGGGLARMPVTWGSRGRRAGLAALLTVALALIAAPGAPAASGAIAGTVTDAGTHKPIEGIEACAYTASEEFKMPACATTNSRGEYTLSELAAGEYVVEFSVPFQSTLNYVTQYYKNQLSESKANKVPVSGTTVSGIDAEMAVGGQIAGRVTDASTGAGIEGAIVCAFLAPPEEAGNCAVTAGDGSYTISGLPTGGYRVVFVAKKYTPQVYNGKAKLSEADLVQVTAPNLTSGIDAALAPAVAPAPPSDLNPPAISGSPTLGGALSCSNGLWAGHPAPTFTYAWLRDGVPIAGATASSYTVQAADQGHTLSCRVTATNSLGAAAATSAGLAIPAPPPPPRPKPKLTINGFKFVVSKGAIRVRVRCAGAPCTGRLILDRVVRHCLRGSICLTGGLIFGSGTVSLAANATGVVVIKLNARGRVRFAHAAHRPQAAELACIIKGARPARVRVIVK